MSIRSGSRKKILKAQLVKGKKEEEDVDADHCSKAAIYKGSLALQLQGLNLQIQRNLPLKTSHGENSIRSGVSLRSQSHAKAQLYSRYGTASRMVPEGRRMVRYRDAKLLGSC